MAVAYFVTATCLRETTFSTLVSLHLKNEYKKKTAERGILMKSPNIFFRNETFEYCIKSVKFCNLEQI